jgi:hypothetical protein
VHFVVGEGAAEVRPGTPARSDIVE